MNEVSAGLERGERAPDFVQSSPDGTPTRFYSKAGGKVTILAVRRPVMH